MKIKWIGKYSGSNLPVAKVSPNAKAFPVLSTKSSALIVPIIILFVILVWIKSRILGGIIVTRMYLSVGIIIGILMFPLHELLHALCFPPNSCVFIFFTNQGLGTTCLSPITRNRFILINLIPSVVLGLIPLVSFMWCPKEYIAANSILFSVSFLHVCGSYVDYINAFRTAKISRHAMIQISGEQIFWYEMK